MCSVVMDMKKKLVLLLSLVLIISMFASCKKEATEDEYAQVVPVPEDAENIDPETGINLLPEGNGIIYSEEQDGADLHYKKEDTSKFIGEWEATSDQAVHLYGNIDLTINEDHTWAANITEDDYNGKWEESKTGLKMNGDRFSFSIAFDDGGSLIMTEYGQNGSNDIHTVLTRKSSDEE